jgi:L-cysteine S-thiosulfotransferase
MKPTHIAFAAAAAVIAGCATLSDTEVSQRAVEVMKTSFKERGQAKLDRLDQDEVQALCSRSPSDPPLTKTQEEKINTAQKAVIRYPADGKLLGDWRAGEKIAQTGVGMQFSDNPKNPSGGNCYACHQMTKEEISYGTIGPSLYNFAKIRGYGEDMQKYAYGKVYNPQAYTACSNMPRFGHHHILTEQQIKDVTALLMDPQSPVNK